MNLHKYNFVMNQFVRTIPDNYYMFVITKCCGFQELVIVLKTSNVGDLQRTLIGSVGSVLYKHIYFKNKNNNDPDERFHLNNTNTNTLQLVSDFIKNLTLVYTIDECPYPIYQLYYDYECCCHQYNINNINNVVETNETMDIYENELVSTNNITQPTLPTTPRELIRESQEINNNNTNYNFVLEPLEIPENIELEEFEYCLRPPCLRREVELLPRVSAKETVTGSYNSFSYDLDYIV